MKNKIVSFLFIFVVILLSCVQNTQNKFPVLKGPYLGQKPPGMTPEIFAPGIISTGYNERIAAFTPDGKELYYALWGAPHGVILFTKEINGIWTKPQVAPFRKGNSDLFISFMKDNGNWTKAINMGEKINSSDWEFCPTVSPDGKYLFFTSNRRLHKPYSEISLTYDKKLKILDSPGNGSADIYWVDAKIIDELKPKELK
jgi:hypothetical protein